MSTIIKVEAKASKANIWAQVEAILTTNKVKSNVVEELKAILAPKSGGGISTNPSYVKDGITMHYCRFHQQYEAECDMVMSGGKSKGYCKAGISLWNKTNAQIKKLESFAVGAMCKNDFDKAKELSMQAKELQDKLNDPSSFNYDKDWAIFNGQEAE